MSWSCQLLLGFPTAIALYSSLGPDCSQRYHSEMSINVEDEDSQKEVTLVKEQPVTQGNCLSVQACFDTHAVHVPT